VGFPNPPAIKLRLTRRRRIRLAEIQLAAVAFREAVYSRFVASRRCAHHSKSADRVLLGMSARTSSSGAEPS
jgi:hypothetical protein